MSIVTPSYNQAAYIEETIRSVLLQGYPNLEYIIIDGGSTDGSVDIIRQYAPWLAYWVSEPDRGQAHAINKGWIQATGQILAYLNSDDCYLGDAIGIAAQGFLSQPQAGMVYGTASIVDEAGKTQRMWTARPFELKTMLLVDNVVPQPAAFFSAEVFKSVGYLVEQLHMIMDYELCIRIGTQYPSACLPATLAQFRDHSHSKTRTQSEVTAHELIRFAQAFFAHEGSRPEVQAIRRATLSRYHYMLALGYIAAGRPHAAQSLKPLVRSLQFYLPFVLKRPVQTAYVVKEILLSYLARVQYRLTVE